MLFITRFSSPIVSDQYKSENKYAVDNGRALNLEKPEEEECLSREICLENLALIRRVRWFNNEVNRPVVFIIMIYVGAQPVSILEFVKHLFASSY